MEDFREIFPCYHVFRFLYSCLQVENELPEKIERLVRCEASAYQKLLMRRVEDNLGSIGSTKVPSLYVLLIFREEIVILTTMIIQLLPTLSYTYSPSRSDQCITR